MTTAVKDQDGRRVGERDAHVWHCSLNLSAEEGALADEQWARICEAFVERMGFTGEHPCRWVAVRHSASKSGNDHVHVVVSRVHEDGRAANVWNDRPRAQQAWPAASLRSPRPWLSTTDSDSQAAHWPNTPPDPVEPLI